MDVEAGLSLVFYFEKVKVKESFLGYKGEKSTYE